MFDCIERFYNRTRDGIWSRGTCRGRSSNDGMPPSALTARQRSWAASISLHAMAIPAALEPGPLVTLVRCLPVVTVVTVAKLNSLKWDLP